MLTCFRDRVLAVATSLGLCVAAVALAGPAVHRAEGGGTVAVGDFLDTIAFTAQIDDAGAVKGQAQFNLRSDDVEFHVEIDCLSVSGNQAWMEGVITESSDPGRVGSRVQWTVVDNGEGDGNVDRTSLPVAGSPGSCNQHPALTLIPWTNGNVQVDQNLH